MVAILGENLPSWFTIPMKRHTSVIEVVSFICRMAEFFLDQGIFQFCLSHGPGSLSFPDQTSIYLGLGSLLHWQFISRHLSILHRVPLWCYQTLKHRPSDIQHP